MSKPKHNQLLGPVAELLQGPAISLAECKPDSDWRMAFAWGEVAHPKGDFVVDDEFAREMRASFEYLLTEYGYRPPVVAEHDVEGAIYGLVVAVETRDDGIWVLPRYNAEGRSMADGGRFFYVSPSFFPTYTDPHTGAVLKNVLREFTYCRRPHQKNLKTPIAELYGLSEDGFAEPVADDEPQNAATTNPPAELGDDTEEVQMDERDEMIAKLEARVAELEGELAAAQAEGEGGQPVVPPAPEAAAELSELRSAVEKQEGKIAKLEGELAKSRATARVAADAPGASDEQKQALVSVLLSDEASYAALLPRFVETETPEFGHVGGSAGAVNNSDRQRDLKALVVEAHGKQVKRGLELIRYVRNHGGDPTNLNEVADQVYR